MRKQRRLWWEAERRTTVRLSLVHLPGLLRWFFEGGGVGTNPEEAAMWREAARQTLDVLDIRLQIIARLHYGYGMSGEAIARRTGWNPRTVRYHARRLQSLLLG